MSLCRQHLPQMLWHVPTNKTNQRSALMQLFHKSFGIEVQPMTPLVLGGRLCPEVPAEVLMALAPLNLELAPA